MQTALGIWDLAFNDPPKYPWSEIDIIMDDLKNQVIRNLVVMEKVKSNGCDHT